MVRACVAALLAFSFAACEDAQRIAFIGDLPLASGEVLRDCRVGYRTFGRLNDAADNAVLIPTWLGGTSEELEAYVGPDGLADPDRFYVILVDTLANGVSSSPSTTAGPFPRLTIADMVESQRRLLDRLGVHRLRAVIGTSMGGMQALEWAAAHPDRVDAVVSIASSPEIPLADRIRWEKQIVWMRLRSPGERAWEALAAGRLREALWHARLPAEDWIAQARALVAYRLTARFDGSMARAAAAMPPMLVVVSAHDPVLHPEPARELARLAGAELLVLDGRCGHAAPGCEQDAVARAVARFLARRPSRGERASVRSGKGIARTEVH